jgi:hypothetical protein
MAKRVPNPSTQRSGDKDSMEDEDEYVIIQPDDKISVMIHQMITPN